METLDVSRPLLTIGEAAERLRVSDTTVRRLIGAGVLPAVRVTSGAIRIEREELADWISERRTAETTVGSGSSAQAVGLSSSVEAGGSPPSRPQTPAAHVRVPEASGSRARMQRAGSEGRT
jgi:excisionase family DNA binding protein